jgi:hypothetical protein
MRCTKSALRNILVEHVLISDGLRYHIDNNLSLHDSIYREGSEAFLNLVCETRKWYSKGYLTVSEEDLELLQTDLGRFGLYEGRKVMLDYPIEAEAEELMEAEYRGRKVKLNKPKRGGKKKFYVYVKNKKGNVIKVSFGQKGMTTGLRDPKRSKSFERRHRCKQKNDKTKPGYWSCRIGRYPKVTGAPYRRWW